MKHPAQPTTNNEWIVKAEAHLQDCYDCIRRADKRTQLPTCAIKPSLHVSEAEYFVRGIEAGVFSIDDQGYVQSPVLPQPSNKGTQKRILQLFWRRAGRHFLFREGVCQVSTVAELVLRYRWPLDHIKMEPRFPELPRLAWAVDISLTNAEGRVVALCEVKRDNREMDQLLTGFKHCCEAGPHSRDGCHFGKNHPKYELCSEVKPMYFLAASPGRAACFKLSYNGRLVIQEQTPGLLVREAWAMR